MASHVEHSKLNWAEKIIIGTSAVTTGLLFSAVSPILPKIQEVFSHEPNALILVKMLIGIIGLSMVVGCPVGGWLANHFSHRAIMGVTLTVFAVAGGFGLLASNLYLLLAARLVTGFAGAVSSTVALVLLSELVEGDTRNAWLGIVVSTSMVASVSIFPVAGFLGRMSWHLPFALYLIMVPVAAICPFAREVKKTSSQTNFSSGAMSIKHYRLLILAFVCGLTGFLPAIYVPFHFQEMGVHDPRLVSLGLATSTLVGAFSSSLYGQSRRKLDIYQSLAISYAATALGMSIVAFSRTMSGTLAGMCVFGAGLAWLSPNLFALLSRLPERDRAATFGIAKGTLYVSTVVGVLMFEPISRAFGADGVLAAIAVSGVAMMAYILYDRVLFSDRLNEPNTDVSIDRPEGARSSRG